MDETRDLPPPDFDPSRAKAAQDLAIPAILMMVMAGLTFLYSLVSLVTPADMSQLESFYGNQDIPEQWKEALRWMMTPLGRFVLTVPGLVFNGLVGFGAWKMKNLRSYGWALTAAILCCIPCCGPCSCLSLVPGIWSLIVLNRPDVKAAFRMG
ncbi:hypothetical protein D7X55_25250 [Corallococcus sp. AB049A]|uniref:Uncharacterized protein n=1 Tax=Corallococcus interemptor TaxID=2316720 RepID=A0A3A8Q9N2_9BACT|nr:MULTISPECIES: hypothetical protein [Corallococcus]RKH45702.1 hypothetical protein D7Y23_25195 [Corallococcus sp. AB050B]RKH65377.1 hypothetical protein D7X96_23735 [Corallococcus interemptor]RKI59827.1 hypothetical protein D7X55_25250 [Corallococcus sp. AB049A]